MILFVPIAVVALVITGGAGLTVRVRTALPVPAEFVALRLTDDTPTAVGVPEMMPVTVLTVNPAGNAVAL